MTTFTNRDNFYETGISRILGFDGPTFFSRRAGLIAGKGAISSGALNLLLSREEIDLLVQTPVGAKAFQLISAALKDVEAHLGAALAARRGQAAALEKANEACKGQKAALEEVLALQDKVGVLQDQLLERMNAEQDQLLAKMDCVGGVH